MRPFTIDIDPANVDADGIADNNASSGTSLTLDGALTSGGTFTSADGLAHQVSITDTATQDQSDSTFTITGTDADGNAQTEAVTGPGAGATVESTKYWLTITSVAISGGDANDTVDMGTVDEVMTPTYMLDRHANLAATYAYTETGTANWDIDECFQDMGTVSSPAQNARWLTKVSGATASAVTAGTANATAIRAIFNSYTNGAELQVDVSQGGQR